MDMRILKLIVAGVGIMVGGIVVMFQNHKVGVPMSVAGATLVAMAIPMLHQMQ